MKRIFLLLLITSSITINAQKEFLDYIVTKENDTIFGKISETLNYWRNNVYNLRDGNGKKLKIKRNQISSLRKNDKIYIIDTLNFISIFKKVKKDTIPNNTSLLNSNKRDYNRNLFNYKKIVYSNTFKRLKDYIVTKNHDTIFGIIKKNNFNKTLKLESIDGTKHKIKTKSVASYRWKNEYYYNLKKTAVLLGDKKNAFLKLLLDGKIKLFEYEVILQGNLLNINKKTSNTNYLNNNNVAIEIHYFLKINDKLKFIPKHRFLKIMVQLFKDDKDLVKRLKKREFTYSNMYLLVKEYNSTH